jgi:hypothetical protein
MFCARICVYPPPRSVIYRRDRAGEPASQGERLWHDKSNVHAI